MTMFCNHGNGLVVEPVAAASAALSHRRRHGDEATLVCPRLRDIQVDLLSLLLELLMEFRLGGILSFILSRYFASSKPLILWFGENPLSAEKDKPKCFT